MSTPFGKNTETKSEDSTTANQAAEAQMQECSLGDDCVECQQCNDARKRAAAKQKQRR